MSLSDEEKRKRNREKARRLRAKWYADPVKREEIKKKNREKMRRLRAKWKWMPEKVEARRRYTRMWNKLNPEKKKANTKRCIAKKPEHYKQKQKEAMLRFRTKMKTLGIKYWLPKKLRDSEEVKELRIERVGNKTIHRLLG